MSCSRITVRSLLRPRVGTRVAAVSAALTVLIIAAIYPVLPAPSLGRSRSASALVLAADGSILRGFLTADGKWRLPVEPEAVDPLYRRMLVAAEDRRFDSHPGADPIAAARALFQLGSSGHIVSGASRSEERRVGKEC